MKINIIRPNERNICLRIPTALMLNRLSAHIAAKAAQKNGESLTFEQVYGFFAALKEFKRTHDDWKFVEVQSSSGEYVEITV